jgi:hypothetical protein
MSGNEAVESRPILVLFLPVLGPLFVGGNEANGSSSPNKLSKSTFLDTLGTVLTSAAAGVNGVSMSATALLSLGSISSVSSKREAMAFFFSLIDLTGTLGKLMLLLIKSESNIFDVSGCCSYKDGLSSMLAVDEGVGSGFSTGAGADDDCNMSFLLNYIVLFAR